MGLSEIIAGGGVVGVEVGWLMLGKPLGFFWSRYSRVVGIVMCVLTEKRMARDVVSRTTTEGNCWGRSRSFSIGKLFKSYWE